VLAADTSHHERKVVPVTVSRPCAHYQDCASRLILSQPKRRKPLDADWRIPMSRKPRDMGHPRNDAANKRRNGIRNRRRAPEPAKVGGGPLLEKRERWPPTAAARPPDFFVTIRRCPPSPPLPAGGVVLSACGKTFIAVTAPVIFISSRVRHSQLLSPTAAAGHSAPP
jgi:hypothetical protein